MGNKGRRGLASADESTRDRFARKGGEAMREKYGEEFYSEIGHEDKRDDHDERSSHRQTDVDRSRRGHDRHGDR